MFSPWDWKDSKFISPFFSVGEDKQNNWTKRQHFKKGIIVSKADTPTIFCAPAVI